MESKLMAPFIIISILSITIISIQADAAPDGSSTGWFSSLPSISDAQKLWNQKENITKMWGAIDAAGKKVSTGGHGAYQKMASYDSKKLSEDMTNARNYITDTSEKALKGIQDRKKGLEESTAAAKLRSMSSTVGDYGSRALHYFTRGEAKAPEAEAHHKGEPAEESEQVDDEESESGPPPMVYRGWSHRHRHHLNGGATV